MGSRQSDALQNIMGEAQRVLFDGAGAIATGAFSVGSAGGSNYVSGASGNNRRISFDASNVARTSSETRPINTAYAPRIHV